VCSVRCGVSREGHGRDRLSLNYRSFMFGKLPPPACPGLCYALIHVTFLSPFVSYPSSTAQGGGGSSKNRKTIGEVGCCESRMAE